jgi:uncharacterized membrane protein
MHVIPQSWAHWHILIGIFPTIGFVLALGVYVAGWRAKNGLVQRTCLALFALLGLLAIPILATGAGAMTSLAVTPRFSGPAMTAHYNWGLAVTAVLVVTGIAALLALWRGERARVSFWPMLVLASATLILTFVADELGFRLNHQELASTAFIPEISTSQVWSHVHIVLNHVPTAGFLFAIAFFVTALLTDNDAMTRASLVLFVICSVVGVPTYVAGTAAMWALTQPAMEGISKAVINAHRDMALWTLFGLAFTGAAAWIELWRFRSLGRFSRTALHLVLLFAIVTLAIMTETGHRGGLINHPEIRTTADILPTDDNAGISAALEGAMAQMIWFVPWQIVHFFGYCLIFGAAAAVALRVLGFWKSLSFAAMHRLLLLGFFGVIMNVVSGMLMMLSDSYRYIVTDATFAPKIALVAIGAIAVLYFSLSDRLWQVQAGQSAALAAKWVAAIVLLAWAGVIICGRLLPYL